MNLSGKATFSPTSFAEGRSRRSYKGTYLAPSNKKGQTCVVKEYKEKYMWAESDWDQDMVLQKKVIELAEKFNKETGTSRPIYYADCDVWKVSSRSSTGTPKLGEWCLVEDYITGEWTKWNTNAGYVNPRANTVSLHAFSHWTWAHTKGDVLVCDLQGVRRDDRYILTDPVICSTGQIYGETDLGVGGMAHFFSTHSCTSFCSHLPKPGRFNDILQGQLSVRQHSHTSFSSEDGLQLPYHQKMKIKNRLRKALETIIEEDWWRLTLNSNSTYISVRLLISYGHWSSLILLLPLFAISSQYWHSSLIFYHELLVSVAR